MSRIATSFLGAIVRSASAQTGQFVPVGDAVEAHADPPAAAYVWRAKEAVWPRVDEFVLRTERGRAPKMWKVMVVMTVWPQHHELAS